VIQEHPEVGKHKRHEIFDYLAAEIQKPGNGEILKYCLYTVCVDAVNDYIVVEDYHKEREAKKQEAQAAEQKPEADFFSGTPFEKKP
jgi:hypothetical protein